MFVRPVVCMAGSEGCPRHLARFQDGILNLVSEIPLVISIRHAVLSSLPLLLGMQCCYGL